MKVMRRIKKYRNGAIKTYAPFFLFCCLIAGMMLVVKIALYMKCF